MSQSRAIHTALKRAMRERGRTYADAAPVLGLSEASIKRLFSRAELSLARLEQLCDWLGIEIGDVVELSRSAEPRITALGTAQERALLADPALLLLAYLVLNRWTEAEILEVFRFQPPELQRHLFQLQRLGLIEVQPFGRIKLRTARNFDWRKDGPIQRFFSEQVLPEFLDSRFNGPGEKLRFIGGMLSRASVLKLHDLIESLAADVDRLIADDLTLPASERHGISVLLGVRPWEFSAFTRLRRKPRVSSFE